MSRNVQSGSGTIEMGGFKDGFWNEGARPPGKGYGFVLTQYAGKPLKGANAAWSTRNNRLLENLPDGTIANWYDVSAAMGKAGLKITGISAKPTGHRAMEYCYGFETIEAAREWAASVGLPLLIEGKDFLQI